MISPANRPRKRRGEKNGEARQAQKAKTAGLALLLLLLTAFSVSRLQAQNEESAFDRLLAEFKMLTALVGRHTSDLRALDARVSALEEASAADPLAGIPIAEENRCIPYHADDYNYPQSVETAIVAAMGGRIYSPYTGQTFASLAETDIDHIVARSEAHESGLCAAGAATRQAFAADPLNLTLADPVLNRDRKMAWDLAEWLPERNRCWYVDRVLAVKRKYGLSMDIREAAAARVVLASCTSFERQLVDWGLTSLVRSGILCIQDWTVAREIHSGPHHSLPEVPHTRSLHGPPRKRPLAGQDDLPVVR